MTNSSPKIDRAYQMVKELIKIHKLIEEEIDLDVKDNKLVCYFLLGGLISLSIRLLRSMENGFIEDMAQYQRIISESMDLVLFFCEPGDKSRQVKAWFEGKIVERKYGNKGNSTIEERADFLNTEKQTIRNIDKTVKVAIKRLSTYFHPSLEQCTVTFDFKIKKFKYYSKRGEVLNQKRIKSLLRLGLHPVVLSFGHCLDKLFLLDTAEYLEKMANFTRELYPESFSKSD